MRTVYDGLNQRGLVRGAGMTLLALMTACFDPQHAGAAPSLYAPPTASDQRQYAPSREVDILHLAIDVTPDFKRRTIASQVTLKFKPIAKSLPELRLDGVDLQVRAVSATATVAGWQATTDQIIVTFEPPLPPDQETTLTIDYSAAPKEGLYFRTPELGYRPEDTHLFTQGEAVYARQWYPGFDSPNEKFTSAITCRVPEGMVVLSNGRLVAQDKDPATGLVAIRWEQDKPHANYLISLLAGHFKKLEDRYRDIPLAFWTVPSSFPYAKNSFQGTKDMLAFFEQEIGVPYPWAKYDQVCVQDFVAGGMENTSITTLREETLFTDEFENARSSQGLVAHELAHQWFGDLVTCKDWSHLWLNEGFATYYEHLYDGHKHGRDELRYRLYLGARSLTGHPDQTNAIIRRDFATPGEQFNHLNYGKGAWVLHMLRSQLGADLYRRCIRTFLERHAYGSVTTEDLNRVLEELSGQSFDRFFDQWVYHASQPELNVSYEWQERSKLARVSVRQDQKVSDRALLFEFPLPLRFKTEGGVVERQVMVKQKSEDFYFPLPAAPQGVRIDPDLTVLAKINFTPPPSMSQTQLNDPTDMIGRLMAVEQLGEKRERGSIAKLQHLLNNDPFYGVRLAAAKALRAIGTDEALEALLASRRQSDARVRLQVVNEIGGGYREASYAALTRVLDEEKNPDIQAAALQALGAYQRPEVQTRLLGGLKSTSFRNVLAVAALQAMRAQDDPRYLEPLRQCLQKRQADFSAAGFGQGLETLAFLAREEDRPSKDKVREFLLTHVNSPKQRVKLAALNALGVLGDPKAVAVLEKFSSVPRGSEKAAAERAIERLRAGQKSAAELGALRNDVLSLQKEIRDLRKEVEDLKKKFDALGPERKAGKTPAPAPEK